MSTPELSDLDSFVTLLRTATPSAAELAPVRRRVLARAGISPWLKLVLIPLALTSALGAPHNAREASVPEASTKVLRSPVAIVVAQLAPPSPVSLPAPVSPPPPVHGTGPGGGEPRRLRAARSSSLPQPLPQSEGEPAQAVLAEVPAPPAPAISETFTAALADEAAGRTARACEGFSRVAAHETNDPPAEVARAQYGLGTCLFALGFHNASLSAFDTLTQSGPQHPYFDASLPWLARLADRLPEGTAVAEVAARYGVDRLRVPDEPDARQGFSHLLYLLGRASSQGGKPSEAIPLLHRVEPSSPWSLSAGLLEGTSYVRMHRSSPAAQAFRAVIDRIARSETGGALEPTRLRDLAWLSLARLYYSVALARESTSDGQNQLLTRAYEAWGHIDERSPYFADAFHEETWALYMTHDRERALGHIHGIGTQYFEPTGYPEALVLRAMIHFEDCQWDAADAAVHEYHQRFDPLLADVERSEARLGDHGAAYELATAVDAAAASVPERARPALRHALWDRDLERYRLQVSAIDAERGRLRQSGFAPEGALFGELSAQLAIARAFALDRADEQARSRLTRLVADLRERASQIDTIEAELARGRREELARPNPNPMGPANGGPIWAVQGDQVWPFDGEVWPDEVPYYRQVAVDRCQR